jgi:regulator of replication initiation timing
MDTKQELRNEIARLRGELAHLTVERATEALRKDHERVCAENTVLRRTLQNVRAALDADPFTGMA